MQLQTPRIAKRTRPTRRAMHALLTATLLAAGVCGAEERTGSHVFETLCIACHEIGRDGAPRIGNAYEWAAHARFGPAALSENAIGSIRKMPAHGGQATLSDLEISRAVVFMVSNGIAGDPNQAYIRPTHWEGEQIFGEACARCHTTGIDKAPKIGDTSAWLPRLKAGIDPLVKSALKGHQAMPARGGMTHLSHIEIRAAVAHMVSRIPVSRRAETATGRQDP